jgi:flagellar biosynthetic protein FlhB
VDDGSKTEQATPHKRQEAREEGRVAVSRDLTAGLTLVAALVAGRAAWDNSLRYLSAAAQWTFRMAGNRDLSSEGVQQLWVMWQGTAASVVLPLVIAAAAVGLGVGLGQTRLMFATKALQPKFSMLNPAEGLKRIFSTRGLVEAAKSVLKVTLVLGMATWAVWTRREDLGRLCNCSVGAATGQAFCLVYSVALRCAGLLALIGVADYAYQWWEYERSLRMSRQRSSMSTSARRVTPTCAHAAGHCGAA